MATTLQARRFTITKTNDTGFQPLEEPGVWFNVSKYAKPTPAIPPVGSRVEATVDPRGFVMAIELVKENGVLHEQSVAIPPVAVSPAPPDQTETGLRILEIAARFLATRPDAIVPILLTPRRPITRRWPSYSSGTGPRSTPEPTRASSLSSGRPGMVTPGSRKC